MDKNTILFNPQPKKYKRNINKHQNTESSTSIYTNPFASTHLERQTPTLTHHTSHSQLSYHHEL